MSASRPGNSQREISLRCHSGDGLRNAPEGTLEQAAVCGAGGRWPV